MSNNENYYGSALHQYTFRARLRQQIEIMKRDCDALAIRISELEKILDEDAGSSEGDNHYKAGGDFPNSKNCVQSGMETMSIYQLELQDRIKRYLIRAQINTIGELLDKSEDDLKHFKHMGVGRIGDVRVALDKMGLRLKGDDGKNLPQKTVPEVVLTDDRAADTAIIMDILRNLGYDAWNPADEGLQWAMEAILFSMNNPKLSTKIRIYVWSPIAGREGVEVAEVVKTVNESMCRLKPAWKKLKYSRTPNSPEREAGKQILDYAEKVFWSGDYYLGEDAHILRELVPPGRNTSIYSARYPRWKRVWESTA